MSTLRKIKISIICAFLLIFALLFKNILAFGSFYIGKYYYHKHSYTAAKKCFGLSKDIKPNDADYSDFYTRTLVKIPLDYQTQKELYEITRDTASNPAAILADNRLETFKSNTLKYFERNYISSVASNNKIIRWDEKKFPLLVFIEKTDGISDKYVEVVQSAFQEWDNALGNFFKFKFIDDKNTANIIVNFILTIDKKDKTAFYIAGQTVPEISGSHLEKMVISLNTKTNLGEEVGETSLYSTAFHEIGHALGIMGHSSNYNDLMYIEAPDKISQADINTMKLLYLIVPDISNSQISDMSVDTRIYAPLVIGSTEQLDNEQYMKAITYIQKAPDVSAGWVELATFYYQIKNHPKAIKSLLQAKMLSTTDGELYSINYNLAMVYMEMKEYNNSLIYLGEAQKINPEEDLRSLIAFSKYKAGDKNSGIKELHTLVQENPADINTGFILADIYFAETDFIKTVQVLKWLKSNNIGFKKDPRLKKYKLLNFFV